MKSSGRMLLWPAAASRIIRARCAKHTVTERPPATATDAPVARYKNLQAHEAENIIGALREVNQILTLEEDIRTCEGLGTCCRIDPFELEDDLILVLLGADESQGNPGLSVAQSNQPSRKKRAWAGPLRTGCQETFRAPQLGGAGHAHPLLVLPAALRRHR